MSVDIHHSDFRTDMGHAAWAFLCFHRSACHFAQITVTFDHSSRNASSRSSRRLCHSHANHGCAENFNDVTVISMSYAMAVACFSANKQHERGSAGGAQKTVCAEWGSSEPLLESPRPPPTFWARRIGSDNGPRRGSGGVPWGKWLKMIPTTH